MSSLFSTAGLARRSGSRPWLVVAAWVLVMVLAGALIPRLGDALTSDTTFTNNPESVQGFTALEDAGLRDDDEFNETIVIRSDQYTVDSPEFQAVVTQATDAARGVTEWVDPNSVFNYYEATATGAPEAEALVSEDRHATIIPVTLLPGVVDEPAPYLDAIHEQAAAAEGFELLTVGTLSINEEFNTIAEEDLAKGEGIGGIFALIVLVFVFGALLAAVVPIVLAISAIFVSLGLTAALGYFFDLSFFITNMITMIGLAVGIDYALFIVERYREERRRGLPKLDAIEFAGATASKAVFFSGVTVVFALLGMFLVPTTIFRSLGRRRDPRRDRRGRRHPDPDPGRPGPARRQDRLAAPPPLRRRHGRAAEPVRPRDHPRRLLGPGDQGRHGPPDGRGGRHRRPAPGGGLPAAQYQHRFCWG